MGLDLDKTLTQIQQTGDEGTLNRILGFVGTGDQSSENVQARNAIEAKLKALQAQRAQAQLSKEAQEYRANIPAFTQNAFSKVADETRRGLAENLAGQKSDYNKKGLLYSGLKQGADASARGQAAAGLSQARASINQGAEQQARAMEQAAAQGTIGSQQSQVGADQDAYAKAMENAQRRRQTIAAAGQAIGQLGGGVIGKAVGGLSGGGG